MTVRPAVRLPTGGVLALWAALGLIVAGAGLLLLPACGIVVAGHAFGWCADDGPAHELALLDRDLLALAARLDDRRAACGRPTEGAVTPGAGGAPPAGGIGLGRPDGGGGGIVAGDADGGEVSGDGGTAGEGGTAEAGTPADPLDPASPGGGVEGEAPSASADHDALPPGGEDPAADGPAGSGAGESRPDGATGPENGGLPPADAGAAPPDDAAETPGEADAAGDPSPRPDAPPAPEDTAANEPVACPSGTAAHGAGRIVLALDRSRSMALPDDVDDGEIDAIETAMASDDALEAWSAKRTYDGLIAATGRKRLDALKEAVGAALEGPLAPATIGLVTFAGCSGVLSSGPYPPDRHGALREAVSGLRPAPATPLAEAIDAAVASASGIGASRVLLVSDGRDTCGGDPCAAARRAAAAGIALDVVAIGNPAALACVAEAGGGTLSTRRADLSLEAAIGDAVADIGREGSCEN